MKPVLCCLAALGMASLPSAGTAQDVRPLVAVLPFENGGSYGRDKEDFDALRRGLAGTLMSELSATGTVQAVRREQVQQLVDDRSPATEKIDLATAAQIGKTTGARYTVAATFIDLYGDFRVDAQIIDVSTGQVVTVVRSDPKLADRSQMHRIVQSVADRVLEAIKISPPPRPARGRNIPTEALGLYSRALLYQDRGDRPRAIDYLKQALKSFPGYAEAEEALRRQGGV